MPRTYKMSWERRGRWTKMIKGTRFQVSCVELGLPPDQHTKEASGLLANDWLECQLKNQHPKASLLDSLEARLDVASASGDRDDVELLTSRLTQAKRLKTVIDELPLEPSTVAMLNTIRSLGGTLPDDLPNEFLDAVFNPQEPIRDDRAKRLKGIPASKQLGNALDAYLKLKRIEVNAGKRSLVGWGNLRDNLNRARTFFGSAISVDDINAQQVESYFLWLSSGCGDIPHPLLQIQHLRRHGHNPGYSVPSKVQTLPRTESDPSGEAGEDNAR